METRPVLFLDAILQFAEEWWMLSNFSLFEITIDGKKYPSVEHYYQAMKALTNADHELIRNSPSPDEAKRLGGIVSKTTYWRDRRIVVMRRGLSEKFKIDTQPGQVLLSTGLALLAEGNSWGDGEWGVFQGKGRNLLGILLMERRGVLRSQTPWGDL